MFMLHFVLTNYFLRAQKGHRPGADDRKERWGPKDPHGSIHWAPHRSPPHERKGEPAQMICQHTKGILARPPPTRPRMDTVLRENSARSL